jgi:hypothetical protein
MSNTERSVEPKKQPRRRFVAAGVARRRQKPTNVNRCTISKSAMQTRGGENLPPSGGHAAPVCEKVRQGRDKLGCAKSLPTFKAS